MTDITFIGAVKAIVHSDRYELCGHPGERELKRDICVHDQDDDFVGKLRIGIKENKIWSKVDLPENTIKHLKKILEVVEG